MVKSVDSPLSPAVALLFNPFCTILHYCYLCVGVFDFAWVCNSFSYFDSTIIFLYAWFRPRERVQFMPVRSNISSLYSITAHVSDWSASAVLIGHMFPMYYLLPPHTHGPPLLPSCGNVCACRFLRNGPWKPARFLGLFACHPTIHRIFLFLLSWGSADRLRWPLYLPGLGC